MALNQMGMLLSNHVARWVNCNEMFLPRGSSSVTTNVLFSYVTEEDTSHCNLPPPPCILRDCSATSRLVRPSLTNTGEQRGRGGLTNITISSQVACDHRKVFRVHVGHVKMN